MPRPITNKRGATVVATASSSLANVLGMGRTNLQDAAQQAATCAAAPTPTGSSPGNTPHEDVESEGGLSEDELEEFPSPSLLRRDILHDRQRAYQSVVAPISCSATVPLPDEDEESNNGEESIPTRPASVDHNHRVPFPSEGSEVSESSSTPAKVPTDFGGYTENDWDRPLGQTNHWYDDALYYDDLYHAQMTGGVPQHAFVSAAPLPHPTEADVPDSMEVSSAATRRPRRVRPSATGVYGQVTYEATTESDDDDDAKETGFSSSFHNQRQDTEPHSHLQDYGHHHHQEQHGEHEEDNYNPECPCEECVEVFMTRQRSGINARWGHLFPVRSCPQPSSMVVAPRSQQQGQQQFRDHNHSRSSARRVDNGVYNELGQPTHPRGTKGGNPFAVVACCYFKQKGFCKMGPDCWYSHDADESTPCHYGALCKANGHTQLVKNASDPGAAVYHGQNCPHSTVMSSMSTVVPHVRPTIPANVRVTGATAAPQRPTALLVPSVAPCAFCGANSQNVMTQEFPVYQGATRSVGHRAHCTECLRTYSL